MFPLIFDDNKINILKEYAERNIITLDEIISIMNHNAKLVGDRSNHCISLDVGYRFVYSIEETPSLDFKEIYTIKRLSGSTTRPGRYPSIEAMRIMLEKFGMKSVENCQIRKLNETDTIPNIEFGDIIAVRQNLVNQPKN